MVPVSARAAGRTASLAGSLPSWAATKPLYNWHNMGMWIMLFFVIVHIYMAVRADIIGRQSSISTIISGWRMFKDDQP